MKIFKIITVLLLISSSYSTAQKYILDSIKPLYSFPNWEANTIKMADASPKLQKVYKRLYNISQGEEDNLHIFHIGGSHIQADIYSNKLRSYLHHMSETSKGQRGFIFPYRVAKTNNPRNYKVDASGEWQGYRSAVTRDSITWGMSGVTAVFKDTLSHIKLKANYKNYYEDTYDFNSLRVFYNDWANDYNITFNDSIKVINVNHNKKAHYTEYTFATKLMEVDFCIQKVSDNSEAQFLFMGLELINDNCGIEYTSIGVNGASFKRYERCFYFEDQLLSYIPDLFIISVGTNDTYTTDFDREDYKKRYNDFIALVKKANPNVAFIFTVPNDSYYKRKYPNPFTKEARDVIYELAEEHKMGVWDFYEIMGGFDSSKLWYNNDLMPKDLIHFTYLGYSIKADLFLEAFTKSIESTLNLVPKSLLNQIINE